MRKRDWGTTPVLFSLKNVQPMLVAGPPRQDHADSVSDVAQGSLGEVNGVNASTSNGFAGQSLASTSTCGTVNHNVADEARVRPSLAPLKNMSYQNWAASAFVVVLILFVVAISVKNSPSTDKVADAKVEKSKDAESSKSSPNAGTATVSTPVTNATKTVDWGATPSSSAAQPSLADSRSDSLMVPESLLPNKSPAGDFGLATDSKTTPSIPPILEVDPAGTDSLAAPTASQQNANQAPFFASAPTVNSGEMVGGNLGTTAPNNPGSQSMNTAPSNGMDGGLNLELSKPQLNLGPASPAGMTSVNNPNPAGDVAVNIQQTLTPDKPLAAFKELYDEAKRFGGETVSNSSMGSVNATPVSMSAPVGGGPVGSAPAGYQPIYGATQQTATPNANVASGTQLSGQSYPPVSQPYQPISVQDAGGAANRYQPIRQPSPNTTDLNPQVPTGNGTMSGVVPAAGMTAPVNAYVPTTTSNPYVPVGSTSFPIQN